MQRQHTGGQKRQQHLDADRYEFQNVIRDSHCPDELPNCCGWRAQWKCLLVKYKYVNKVYKYKTTNDVAHYP